MPRPGGVEWLNGLFDAETALNLASGPGTWDLDTMRRLCSALGDPQDAVPAVHVTGTNGKGSVVVMLGAILGEMGLSVGRYTSPDLGEVTERLHARGLPIDASELDEVLLGVEGVCRTLGLEPTRFEALTAAAFRWFAERPVDISVLEVGMLGRLDATNVVSAEVNVITSLAPDHLPEGAVWDERTRRDLLVEKAGIVDPGSVVVTSLGDPAAREVIGLRSPREVIVLGEQVEILDRRIAVGGQWVTFGTRHGGPRSVVIPAAGIHQADNAALALAAAEEVLDREVPQDALESALGGMTLPGRCEVLSRHPLVIADVAHNPAALSALAAAVVESFPVHGSRVVVFATTGRDPAEALAALSGLAPDVVIACRPPTPRATDPRDVAAAGRDVGLEVEVIPGPAEAVGRALAVVGEEDLVLICGCHSLVAEVSRSGSATPGGPPR